MLNIERENPVAMLVSRRDVFLYKSVEKGFINSTDSNHGQVNADVYCRYLQRSYMLPAVL